MSRRDQIRMTPEEIASFLDEQRTVICATAGPDGWPHLMPLWYVVREGTIWAWTYGASQKVRNLERDPRATLQVEAGSEYAELRGAMFKTRVAIHRDTEDVARLGTEIYTRYVGEGDFAEMVAAQAPKRVALEFVAQGEPATWDHRKLGGTY